MACLPGGRVGAPKRVRTRLAQLRALRRAARARGRPRTPTAGRAEGAAVAEGPLPARQPAPLQPEVLPELAAALRRLRASPRPAARRDRHARGRVVPAVRGQAGLTLAAGLLLAMASTAALNFGYFLQQQAASGLPALTVRRPLRSLRHLFGNLRWAAGFFLGIGGWVLYVAALALSPLS